TVRVQKLNNVRILALTAAVINGVALPSVSGPALAGLTSGVSRLGNLVGMQSNLLSLLPIGFIVGVGLVALYYWLVLQLWSQWDQVALKQMIARRVSSRTTRTTLLFHIAAVTLPIESTILLYIAIVGPHQDWLPLFLSSPTDKTVLYFF